MKKIITLVFALAFLYSCNDSSETVGTTSEIAGNVIVDVLQTQGTAVSYVETVSQNLNPIIPNLNSVTNITVNRLDFFYGNVTGNANAVIESGTITVNGITIETIIDVNVKTQADNETVFSVTNQSILNQIGALFLENEGIVIEFIGSVLSEEGPVNFAIVVSLNITADL
tara:strand:+ start:47806 stop:48315 length:510 start_codon:yes stop_codon:yes gene_type:complete